MGKSVAENKALKKKVALSSEDETTDSSGTDEESDLEAAGKIEEDSSSSDTDDGSDSDVDEEDDHISGKKRSLVESESSDDQEEESVKIETDEQPVKKVKVETIQKKVFGAEGHTVWAGQLDFKATKDDIKKHFSRCGEVTEVRLRTHPQTGHSRGFAYIDFADAEGKNKALELDGSEFMGRVIKVDNAGAAKPRTADNQFGPKSNTVFVANLAYNLTEDDLRQVFEKFGTIVGDIRLPYNSETGAIRGIGYIEFETEDQAEAAVKGMNGVYVEGRAVRTDFSGGDDSERVRSRPSFNKFSKFSRGDNNRGRGGRGRGRGGGDRHGGSQFGRGRKFNNF